MSEIRKEAACRNAFTQELLKQAREDKRIIALTSDATGSVSLGDFSRELPGQFVEVGIAEQNLVGSSAGLASTGKKPFACGPASFLAARSFEQVKVDVAYSGMNVKLIGVSGGVSYGALGESHYSVQDLASMRAIANMTVLLPADAVQTAALTRELVSFEGPVYMRMGRGKVPCVYEGREHFEIGKAYCLKEGTDLTLIAAGEMVDKVREAARELEEAGIKARVLDMFTIKPLDEEAVIRAARETGAILTVEEHSVCGGLGGAVAQTAAEHCPVPMRILGLPSEVLVGGSSGEIHRHYGLCPSNIVKEAKKLVERK